MRFIHTADIHLDSPLQGLEAHEDAPVDEIRGATRKAFANLITLAIEEEVDFLLIAGDLYDGDWKDHRTGLFFARQMGRLDKEGIRVFLVSGNHDAACPITRALPLPGNVTHFAGRKPQSVTLAELGVIIHGQSYATRAVNENLARQFPQGNPHFLNIGLLHTSLNGREGHEAYAPCSLAELKAKGYDYWALGHIHAREIVCAEPWVVFPGNIQGRHIRETGAKGATLVTVADGQITTVEERELDVLRWTLCRVDLQPCATREEVHAQVRMAMEEELAQAAGRFLAMRLHLIGATPLHGDLHARSRQWTEEFRALAAALGGLWLEAVTIGTTRTVRLEEIIGEESPLAGLLPAVAALDLGGAALTALVPDLARLYTKLPAELLAGGALPAHSHEELHALREDVQELLIAKLLQQEGGG